MTTYVEIITIKSKPFKRKHLHLTIIQLSM